MEERKHSKVQKPKSKAPLTVTRFWVGMVGLGGCWSCELEDAEEAT